jgi:hypothetical protein
MKYTFLEIILKKMNFQNTSRHPGVPITGQLGSKSFGSESLILSSSEDIPKLFTPSDAISMAKKRYDIHAHFKSGTCMG